MTNRPNLKMIGYAYGISILTMDEKHFELQSKFNLAGICILYINIYHFLVGSNIYLHIMLDFICWSQFFLSDVSRIYVSIKHIYSFFDCILVTYI